jgi:prepilin-type N-terminal cleavage/methylation domain-containing protein/prepilin-type processing-associated H-X9-DG protein
MNKKQGFTLIELLVVISVIAILLAILMPSLRLAKEAGQRIACLGNLKGLQTAWELYANANDEKIVNGEAWYAAAGGVDGTNGARNGNEPYWCGDDTADAMGRTHLTEDVQRSAIESGALFSYCKSVKIYHCSTGVRGEVRNYAMVDSMNGYARTGTSTNGTASNSRGILVGNIRLWCKTKPEITKASSRMVFGDEGMATTDSIATNYTSERWWDPGQVRHSNGNTYSFADGHCEYWKWKGKGTIANGRLAQPAASYQPVNDDDFKDLYKFQTAVWGKLGYEPTHSMQ